MIVWAALGMLFKAVSWSIAFFFLAKGSGKLFFWNELITNVYLTALNIGGYFKWGLTGMGYAYALTYFIYFIQVFIITNRLFNFKLEKSPCLILIIQLVFACISILILFNLNGSIFYLASTVILVLCIVYSYYSLNTRVDIKNIINNIMDIK
jgi:hypothetical protein